MEGPGEEAITLARRAVVSRRLFFSHRIVRPLFGLMGFDLLCAFVFAALPDSRTAESDQASSGTQNAAKPFPGVYARAAAVLRAGDAVGVMPCGAYSRRGRLGSHS